MFNWAKNAVGITEREYGPEAIQPVTEQAKQTPWTEPSKQDIKWEVMDTTNVETKTFYMTTTSGKLGLAQVIYSNVLGVRTTAQFNCKLIDAESATPELWASDNLSNVSFSDDKANFFATGVSMELIEDGKAYRIKSSVNKTCVVDLTFRQAAPGFMVGKDGTSNFGTDPKQPWGRMRHMFWPRCVVEGTVVTQKMGPVECGGRGVFIHALQGMKPHFAACKWNFLNFQSPTYSVINMEFTTPPSYGSTVVTVGAVAVDGAILFAGGQPAVKHTETSPDSDNAWPEPKAISWEFKGTTSDGTAAEAKVEGSMGTRMDRVDVMGEMPKFVKGIVAGASGAKPYIYQYCPKLPLTLMLGEKPSGEEGQLFVEATFIS